MRINNNNYQKNANIALVSQMIWKNPGISRVEIARQLDLYRSTVTSIISTLLDENVVYEGETGDGMSKGGRKPITLRLNPSFGCVVGFDIQPSHYRAVLLDLTGAVLWKQSGNIPQVDFDGVFTFLMKIALEKVEEVGIPLLAVCIGIPGIVNADNCVILYAEPFKLHNYDCYSFFHKRYHVPVFVENDANCTAWLEMAHHRGIDLGDFITVIADYHEGSYQFGDRSGIGVGIGLCLGRKIYAGSHHASGEICTLSWRGDNLGQTGLDRDVLVRSASEPEAWESWMADLFASLVPVVSVLDPRTVFIHGQPFSDQARLDSMMERRCPQFKAVLKKVGCTLVCNAEDTVVAEGAALMFLEKLFSVPELTEMENRCHFTWDDVLAQSKRSMQHGYQKREEDD
ncbi:MAG: ROK family transcriptional regulator [Sphaerochaeta sp.]|jgi:predicted NBD/HSP70 family sugar kinase|nr:ROK family transcriptional regulator [Sphaerochaeta sp.]MCI2104345.1 ROK family transcriptional regulator [Sphaerochaeta sp.]MCI2128866.1 ROK family transcriptional regulator [Sphaerochaeta sp.]